MKTAFVYLARALFVLVLPIYSDALYFALNPGYTECIYFHASKGDHLIGSFEIDSVYEAVRVSLSKSGENSKIMDKIDNSGDFTINAHDEADYQLCFKNLMNSVQQTVNFSVKNVSYNSKMNNVMSNVESKKLIDSMEKLYEKISVASEKQKYALTRKRFQMEAIKSSRKRSAIWSVLELLVSFGLVAIQVYCIKSYFHIKYLV
ncbi:P24 like gold domain-containing protein [Cryptosporidium canis]|uniref:P24 like gold domain-containing protein n=1 Tax=Cryptosporidium canis TaxID=195482 RepID=A0ABQ8PCU3_9CRYT|nr:P24 like gold domain-containing protein [Cryptosporidium canis]KAJ1615542.1 P24 like gold domain-containing protein [Cryptosporidium canis]